MALSIDIAANTRKAQGQVQDLGEALEDVGDALDDVAREGDKAGDKLERTFRDMVRDSKRAGDDIGDNLDGVGDKGIKGFGKAGDAAGEFKAEALSNLSEVTSSFDGSLDSVGDLVQGTFGGLAGSLPGVLGAGGAAAAAAVGVITSAFQDAAAASDEAKESAYEYGLTVAESGKFADAATRINDLTGSIEGLQKVQDIATISGWKQKDVLTALATGDGLPALTEAFNEGANSTTIATNRALALQGVLDGTAQGFSLSADAADLNSSALYDLAKSAGKATGEVDDLGNEIVTMPDGKQVVIDAKTKQAYEDIDALEKKKVPTKTVPVKADTSAFDRSMDAIQRRAARGVTVTVRPGQGSKQLWQ